MPTAWKTHRLGQDETLEILASRYLGSAARWRELAVLNRLRAPYTSKHPAEWFGAPLAVGLLTADLSTGADQVPLLGERADVFEQGTVWFLDGRDAAGQYVYDALPVLAYDEGGGVLFLFDPLRQGWRAGTRWHLFPAQRDLDTRVARPGETILLPIPQGDTGSFVLGDAELISLYGTDIRLDQATGHLTLADGDLVLVRGRQNIAQALWTKAQLPFGQALLHPEQGNRTHELIGRTNSAEVRLMARAYTRQALEQDPRVVMAEPVVATAVAGDTIAVAAGVALANSPEQVHVNALIAPR